MNSLRDIKISIDAKTVLKKVVAALRGEVNKAYTGRKMYDNAYNPDSLILNVEALTNVIEELLQESGEE